METHALPGARFVDPEGPRAHQGPGAAGAHGRRRLHQRPASRAVLRRVDRLCRAPRLRRRATTSAAWTGSCTRAPTGTSSSSTRRTRTPTSRVLLDVSKSMGFASDEVSQAAIRLVPRRLPGVSLAPAARPRRHRDVRRGRRHARAAVGQALQRAAAHARSREARAAGPAAGDARQAGRALQAPHRSSR